MSTRPGFPAKLPGSDAAKTAQGYIDQLGAPAKP